MKWLIDKLNMLKLSKYGDINLFKWFDNVKYTYTIIIQIIGWMIHEILAFNDKKMNIFHDHKM